jgi:hypothetical protein
VSLGSPDLRPTYALTGASFLFENSTGIPTFKTYLEFLNDVTKGGITTGPDKAKYARYNKSKDKHVNQGVSEYLWVSFNCKSCVKCSNEVSKDISYLLTCLLRPRQQIILSYLVSNHS